MNRAKIFAAAAIAVLPLVNQSAKSPTAKPATDIKAVRVGSINVVRMSLTDFMNKLSEGTHVAFCSESRGDNNANALSSLSLTLNVNPDDDLQTVLDRFRQSYPAVTWSIQGGIILIGSADIHDDPLDRAVKPFSFRGTVGEFVEYLNANVAGLMADTIEVSGMYDRSAVYNISSNSEKTVKEILSVLTRDFGIRWSATVRDQGDILKIPGGPNGASMESRTGRVTLVFSRGPVPELVK
jgi:hypothetical protein